MVLEQIDLTKKGKDGDKFQPTPDEMRTIAEKMKDPEFMKLMGEYMEELQDPAYRKEEEEYLAQIEREAHEGGDHSFDFIFPKPAYYVELVDGVGADEGRVFVNMCTCDKMDEYKEETTGRKEASNWTVPVSVGRPRPETYEGVACVAYDAVFHPATLALGDRSDRFMTFLVEIVVENINGGYQKVYGYRYRRLSSSTAAVKSVGVPANQTLRRDKSAGKKGALEVTKEPVSTHPMRFDPPAAAASQKKKALAAPATAAASAACSASSSPASASANAAKKTATTVAANDAKLPAFTITHRGEVDLTDAWQWRVSDKRIGVPKQLVLAVEFPGLTSAAAIDISINPDGCTVDLQPSDRHPFAGAMVLPFAVLPEPASAKFDKKKGALTVVLDVCAAQTAAVIPEHLRPSTKQGQSADQEDRDDNNKEDEGQAVANTKALAPAVSAAESMAVEDTIVAPPVAAPVPPAPTQEEPAPQTPKVQEKDVVAAVASSPIASAAVPPVAAPAVPHDARRQEGDTADDGNSMGGGAASAESRMSEVMRKIAEARKAREEAERAEAEAEAEKTNAEKAKAEKAAAAAAAAAVKNETADAAETDDKQETTTDEATEAATQEEPVEVIDLRQRQAEWLRGVREDTAKQQQQPPHTSASEDSPQQKSVRFADHPQTEEKEPSSSLHPLIADDLDDSSEAEAQRREMRRRLKEIERVQHATLEAERLEKLMAAKMAELPLKSHYIFEIE